jgi:hypothetical protein
MSKTFRKAPIHKIRNFDSDLNMKNPKSMSRTKQAARLAKEVVASMQY